MRKIICFCEMSSFSIRRSNLITKSIEKMKEEKDEIAASGINRIRNDNFNFP